MSKNIILFATILSFVLSPASAWSLGCPCPIPPFTYCRCCPPPCPVIDQSTYSSLEKRLERTQNRHTTMHNLVDYLETIRDRIGFDRVNSKITNWDSPHSTHPLLNSEIMSNCPTPIAELGSKASTIPSWREMLAKAWFDPAFLANKTDLLTAQQQWQQFTQKQALYSLIEASLHQEQWAKKIIGIQSTSYKAWRQELLKSFQSTDQAAQDKDSTLRWREIWLANRVAHQQLQQALSEFWYLLDHYLVLHAATALKHHSIEFLNEP
jgi:hypothetical protein